MRPLNAKMLRDLWRIKAQAAAIIVVIAIGIALQIMMSGFVSSLSETRDAYYEHHRLSDVYAPVVRAPEYVAQRLRDIPGVQTLETRLSHVANLNLPSQDQSIFAQVLSLPLHGRRHLNEVRLTGGRHPDPRATDEILLLESFAKAHRIAPGDRVQLTLKGKRRWLSVVGTAQSPEFIYFAAPGEFIPDDSRFAVVWMGRPALAAMLNLDGAFNEALFKLLRGANREAVIDHVDRTLKPFGSRGAYGRDEATSDRFLSEEISGLAVTAKTVPPVFMLVAAFLLYIVTSRMIRSEREEIGLVKAFGYTDREVGLHYLQFTLIIALAGIAVGGMLGVVLGRAMVPVYTTYYKLPFLLFRLEFASFATGMLLSLATASLGGFLALRSVFRLTPAEAMRPPTPPDFSKSLSFRGRLARRLDQPSRMVLRRLVRQPWRTGGAVVGIAAGMALSLSMLIIYDGFDVAIDQTFNVVDRSDATVSFSGVQSGKAILELGRIPGVAVVEPHLNVPLTIRNGVRRYNGVLTGLPEAPHLLRALNTTLDPIPMPEEGVVLSTPLAQILDVAVGSPITLEIRDGPQPVIMTRVAGVADSLMGSPAFMSLDALGRALSDPGRVSGATLSIVDGWEARVHKVLNDLPGIAGVGLREDAQEAFQKVMDEGAGSARFVMGVMAFAITFGIVYNVARVAQDESARDLASLRVMGFTHGEAVFVLLGELAIVMVLALPLGLGAGRWMSHRIAAGFSTDLYQIPVVFAPHSYGSSIAVVISAAVVSGWLVQRSIRGFNIALALKTRE